jgi:Tol biopolymer transport system component
MSRRVGGLTVAAALLSLQLAGCGGGQQANCGVNGVRPHPEIGGEILYTCYAQPGGHGGLFLLDIATGHVRALTSDRAWSYGADWSPDASQIVYMSTRDGRSDLYVMDLLNGGRVRRLTNGRGFNEEPSWSRDGAWIVFQSTRDGIRAPLGPGRNYKDLYAVRPDGTDVRRLTTLPGFNGNPAWGPGGSRLAFGSDRDGNFDIFSMAADGGDQRQLTDFHRSGGFAAFARWSPDGSRIVFNASNPAPGPLASIYSIPADGGQPYRITTGFDLRPDWSPDGQWIVFIRQWQGSWELFVARPDGSDVTQLTWDKAVKDVPRWRPH